MHEFFLYFKDLGSVDDEMIEVRLRRLEDDNTILREQVNELLQLEETVKKQENVIQWLLSNQRDDKDVNKKDNAAVGIAEGGF